MWPADRHIFTELKDRDIKSVDAGYADFKIKKVHGLMCAGEACWGQVDFDRRIVFLEASMDDELARTTFMHELIHIMLAIAGYGEDGEFKNEDLTEGFNRTLQLFRRLNKELWEALWTSQN